MAKVVNPEAHLQPRQGDVAPSAEDLAGISLFAQMSKVPSFDRYPGATVLRKFSAGEVICRQGDAGWTAFYILTAGDEQRLFNEVLSPATASDDRRQMATAHLLIGNTPQPRRTGWFSFGRNKHAPPTADEPEFIPNDGPADIDYRSRQAPMFEGELFGEMSCLTRAPRSATVVAQQDCYMLEMLRNILDQMQRDPGYKQQMDEVYRRRVLDGHLRQLSILGELSDEQFASVRDRVELEIVEPGQIICDQHDPSDDMYIIRSGMVKVVLNPVGLLPEREPFDVAGFHADLLGDDVLDDDPRSAVQAVLDSAVLELLKKKNDSREAQQQIVRALNAAIKNPALIGGVGATRDDILARVPNEALEQTLALYPEKVKDFSPGEVRAANRVLLEALSSSIRNHKQQAGPPRVLAYLGRGDIIGEMGLATGAPRSATCVAYDHPDDPKRTAGRVELVRLSADLFREVIEGTPAVRQRIDELVAARQAEIKTRDETPAWDVRNPSMLSRRFEDLGLIQGQKLMLVDLDRCTRCGDCVTACINTHEDGRSRLYLEGPRFGKYLVPATCRQCQDPACMIGCPVGSIQRGDNGQILIRDWCIGCRTCADQCPYGAIQMHDVGLVGGSLTRWNVTASGGTASNIKSPVLWDLEVQSQLGFLPLGMGFGEQRQGDEQLELVCHAEFTREDLPSGARFKLELSTDGENPQVRLNGQVVPIEKVRRQWTVMIDAGLLKRGKNVIAGRVQPPQNFGDTLWDLRIDRLPDAADADIEEKLVTRFPVVCDLCSTLPGQQPACVTMCPHDAALRIDARLEFPT